MNLDPRLPDLFAEALELEGAAREGYLLRLEEESPALAAEVRSLLERGAAGAHRFAGSVWDRIAPEVDSAALLPESIGPYRIVSEIGRGGMGRVFLAEEVREAFTRQLALKVIDRPWGAPDRLRRFRSEVRILASLEHPGIARFLDGGALPDGTWFLALEHVEGEDLVTAARRRGLSIDERVRLLIEVLAAVDYAHEQGIVHRDLKPANILVDQFGRPRLLDFGVAKLLEDEGADSLAVTEPELRIFTPAYASPEQFEGTAVAATADIYSAGVLLYELLTGSRPFGAAGTSRADLEREVLSSEPLPPSDRLRATTESAPRRRRRSDESGEPDDAAIALPGAQRSISRDLDAICLKALRRDPAARYSSAREFAADLERCLAGEPVEASRGAFRYRLRSIFGLHRRRRWALAAAALLSVGVISVLALRWGGEVPPSIAEPAARPFPFSAADQPPIEELVRRFDAAPADVEAGAGLAIALVREQRPEEATLIIARLRQIPNAADDPLVDYVEATLAHQRGVPQQALILFERALAGAKATGRGELVGQIRASRGRLLSTLGRRKEAQSEMEKASSEFESAGDLSSLARVLNDLAIERFQSNELTAAAELLERALVATRAASPTNTGATFLLNLGGVDVLRGRPDLAEARYREAAETFRDLDRPYKLSRALSGLAGALWEQGRAEEGAKTLAEAIELGRPGPSASALGVTLHDLGCRRLEAGDVSGAAAAADELDRLLGGIGAAEEAAPGEILRALIAQAVGEPAVALERLAAARRLYSGAGAQDALADVDLQEADLRVAIGDLAVARALVESTLVPLRGRGSRTAVIAGEILLARIDVRTGDFSAARRRLDGAGKATETKHVVGLQIALAAARSQLAAAEGRLDDARAATEGAQELAERAGRRATALGFEVDLASLELVRGHRPEALQRAAAAERAAREAGWLATAERARQIGA